MKKTKVIMLFLSFFVSGICFAASQETSESLEVNGLSVASAGYTVNITETATDGRDISAAGPFYYATYADDNGGGRFDHYGYANVGNNAEVMLNTYNTNGMTVVQIVIESRTHTYQVGTSAGVYKIPVISDATIKIIYQLGN